MWLIPFVRTIGSCAVIGHTTEMYYTVGDHVDQNRELRDSKAILGAENIALRAQLEKLHTKLTDTAVLVKRGESERSQILCLLNEALVQKQQATVELERQASSHSQEKLSIAQKLPEQNSRPNRDDRVVVALVADLSRQALAIASDCVEHVLSKGNIATPENDVKSGGDSEGMKGVASVIGDSLLAVITSVNLHQTPNILRIAIQAALATQLYEFFEFWPVPYSHAFSKEFWRLWDAIKSNGQSPSFTSSAWNTDAPVEEPTAATQWCSLSTRYIRSELTLEAQLHDESVNASFRAISKILRAAGIPGPCATPQLLRTELGHSINSLWRSAASLAQKVKEECTSEYQLVYSGPGDSYNSDTQISWSSGTLDIKRMAARVACTIQVGVQRSVLHGRSRVPSENVRSLVLSKASVLMDHDVSEMLPLN